LTAEADHVSASERQLSSNIQSLCDLDFTNPSKQNKGSARGLALAIDRVGRNFSLDRGVVYLLTLISPSNTKINRQINDAFDTTRLLEDLSSSPSCSTPRHRMVSFFARIIGIICIGLGHFLSTTLVIFRLLAEPLLALWNAKLLLGSGVALKDLSATGRSQGHTYSTILMLNRYSR
jgi:hypothetical protein